jgi:sporulation protein YlmC with PRC-barrel domain
MHTIPITAAALLVISSGIACADTASSRPNDSPAAGVAAGPIQRAAAPNPLKQEDVSRIEGASVYGGDNRKVGHVSTVLMNPETKRIERLFVASGGVLGVGVRRVAISVERFLWDAEKRVFRLPMTTVNLRVMPEWVEGGTMTGSSAPPRNDAPPADAGR